MTDTMDRSVASAREPLRERGYAAASPRAVLDSARVGQGSTYHHVRGKSDRAREHLEAVVAEGRSAGATLHGGYVVARAAQDAAAVGAAVDGGLNLLTLLGPDA